jgi:(1->4)-alpha-D-glucan 1-alpha-D-glucosylmutase
MITPPCSRNAPRPELFARGAYIPLPVAGESASRLLAFARCRDSDWAVVIVPRLGGGRAEWGDTAVQLLQRAPTAWRSIFVSPGAEPIIAADDQLSAADVLHGFPVALLEPA